MSTHLDVVDLSPDRLEEAFALWDRLWGGAAKQNRAYAEWKFVHNPAPMTARIAAARVDGRVVGLAAAHGSRWRFDGHDLIIPVVGDLIVDRHQAPSTTFVALLERLAERLASDGHRLMVDFARGAYVPTMLMHGWRATTPRTTARRQGPPMRRTRLSRSMSPFGRLDRQRIADLTVSRPRSGWTHRLVQDEVDDAIEPVGDQTFWRWRLANPLADYRVVEFAGPDHRASALLAINRPTRHLGVAHLVEWTGTRAGRMGLLRALEPVAPPELIAWPRRRDDVGLLHEAAFEIDRPTGRLVSDAKRPAVLVRSLHSSTASWGDGSPEDPLSRWAPPVIAFDEH